MFPAYGVVEDVDAAIARWMLVHVVVPGVAYE